MIIDTQNHRTRLVNILRITWSDSRHCRYTEQQILVHSMKIFSPQNHRTRLRCMESELDYVSKYKMNYVLKGITTTYGSQALGVKRTVLYSYGIELGLCD